jgi:hypothetical protein
MVRNNSPQDFGQRVVTRIREHIQTKQTTWAKLRGDDVAAIVQSEFNSFTGEPELPFAPDSSVPLPELGGTGRAGKKPAERDPLFDALYLSTTNGSLAEITKRSGRTTAVALAEIRKVTPDVTPEEIERRALCYKRAHRDWPLTPSSLCKNWSEFSLNPETIKQKLDPYQIPPNWRERFMLTFPGIEAPSEWAEISVPLRTDILRKTK